MKLASYLAYYFNYLNFNPFIDTLIQAELLCLVLHFSREPIGIVIQNRIHIIKSQKPYGLKHLPEYNNFH